MNLAPQTKREERRKLRRLIEQSSNKTAFFQAVSEHQREVDRRIRACKACASQP
jgi:hypothetical protein